MTESDTEIRHTTWLGALWCEREMAGFEWTTGDVECPHCGETFFNPPPAEVDDD